MSKWVMPHEMDEDVRTELTAPQRAAPRWVLPHEEEPIAKEPTAAEKKLAETPKLDRVGMGVRQTFGDLKLGAKQRAGQVGNLVGIKNDWSNEVVNELMRDKEMRDALSHDPYASSASALTDLGLSLLPGARPMRQALYGGLRGALTPMENPEWDDVALKAGKEAALYGLGTKLTNSGLTAVAKSKNAVRGHFADPLQERRVRIFQENGVPYSLGDITQTPGIQRFENTARRIPGSGRTGFLKDQAEKVGSVIENAPEKIAGTLPSNTKEDIGNTLVKAVRDKYAFNRGEARKLYDDVAARVQAVGNPPVPATELSTATNRLLSKYPTAFAKLTDDPKTVDTLIQISQGVSPKASQILGPNGKPIMTAPQLTFDELRTLDSDLGALIRQGRTLSSRGELNNKTFGELVKVQEALRKDIENWSKAVGDEGISTGVAEANKYFRQNVQPFRNNPLIRKVVQDNDFNPEGLADKMFKLDAPFTADQAKLFMTPEGVQAGRYHLLKKAEEQAMNENLVSGYSPSSFLRKTKMGETGPKLFSPDEIGQVEDLQELIRSSRRAAGFNADPETGVSVMSVLPFLSMKIPLAARAFTSAVQSPGAVRFMLSDPRLYTGNGGLGRVTEDVLRRGAASALNEDATGQDFSNVIDALQQ